MKYLKIVTLAFVLVAFFAKSSAFVHDVAPEPVGNEVDSPSDVEDEFPADDVYWPKEGQEWEEGVPTAKVGPPL